MIFARRVEDTFDGIDFLVINAGAIFRRPTVTDDGVEKTLAVNYVSHYVLTRELLPLLRRANGHVVNVSSNGHRFASLDSNVFDADSEYSAFGAYNRSKLALLSFSLKLDRETTDVRVDALHPGFVPGTGFYRRFPRSLAYLLNVLKYVPRAIIRRPVVDTPEAAAMVLWVALPADAAGRARGYFEDFDLATPSETARSVAEQDRLWERTEDRVVVECSFLLDS